jgi:hypothetical protein
MLLLLQLAMCAAMPAAAAPAASCKGVLQVIMHRLCFGEV